MTTAKIQSLRDLRAEMTSVLSGEQAAPADANQVSFESAESVTRLLTKENRELLAVIDKDKPASVAELANMVNRAEPNVSRSLSKLADAGFVVLREGKGKAKVPEVKIRHVTIEIDALRWDDHMTVSAG